MKELSILIPLITLIASNLFSQNLNEFTKLYVEDSKGNIDSVEIQWVDYADDSRVFTEDGEENLKDVPFDSILEMRISNGIVYGERVSKMNDRYFAGTKIGNAPFGLYCKSVYSNPILLIHAKYPPVVVSWDTTFFAKDNCFRGSAIVNHDIWIEFSRNTDKWEEFGGDKIRTYCMLENGRQRLRLDPIWGDGFGWTDFTYDFALNNGDTVRHLAHALLIESAILPYCNYKAIVSNEEVEDKGSIGLYPNPASTRLYIDHTSEGAPYTILNIDGIEVQQGEYPIQGIETTPLPQGVYFIQVRDGNKVWVDRFVKM